MVKTYFNVVKTLINKMQVNYTDFSLSHGVLVVLQNTYEDYQYNY